MNFDVSRFSLLRIARAPYIPKNPTNFVKLFPVKIKIILVPHAGTVLGDKALSYAIKLAKWSGATINILHTVEPLPGPPPLVFSKKERAKIQKEIDYTIQGLVDDIKEELKSRVDFCRSSGINANYIVSKGRPEIEIANYAKQKHIDLIIMTKRRKIPGMVGFLRMGSVSRKILEIS